MIPVCIQGFAQCPYAYGDNSVTNRMHMGNISIWEIKSCIPICEFFHMGITVCISRSQYAYGQGSLKICIWAHVGINIYAEMICPWSLSLQSIESWWLQLLNDSSTLFFLLILEHVIIPYRHMWFDLICFQPYSLRNADFTNPINIWPKESWTFPC